MSAAKNQRRTWAGVTALVVPLVVVGVAAMAISYATLISVARVNGMPLPELFPVLIDVGTVACMVAAAQFRSHGINGRWLAYTTFAALSAISVFANATHAVDAADLSATTVGVAVLLAATPPAALLAITHIVMQLVPDAKEREKIAAAAAMRHPITREPVVEATPLTRQRTRNKSVASRQTSSGTTSGAPQATRNLVGDATADRDDVTSPLSPRAMHDATGDTGAAGNAPTRTGASWGVDTRIREVVTAGGMPTGKEVGEWLGGKSSRTGQRYLAAFLARNKVAEEAISA